MVKKYNSLNGLRTIACIGIILMHIKANTSYNLPGYLYTTVIGSFTNFVFLFMTISAFGMCCGYYEKIMTGTISLVDFYKKRYAKILPFFAMLVCIDILINRNLESLYQGFADVTLLFGFLPNDIEVIGVGWFLGTVFVFYIMFPFFCFLISNKCRMWVAFFISIAMNYLCIGYFNVGRKNIMYSLCYFLLGGIIFVYRSRIEAFVNKYWLIVICGIAMSVVCYYVIGANTLIMLLVSFTLVAYAMGRGSRLLDNSITSFISNISMEMYLSHMVIFRAIQVLKIDYLFGQFGLSDLCRYVITAIIVICGTIVFSIALKRIIAVVNSRIYILMNRRK